MIGTFRLGGVSQPPGSADPGSPTAEPQPELDDAMTARIPPPTPAW